jgi:hypothetical protein
MYSWLPGIIVIIKEFWRDLIKNNDKRICYFHNFGGYDAILSLNSLLTCLPNLKFNPILKDGELMSLEVLQGTTKLITIKDSIRILPASLSKLAKDWKVPTLKDHFPHYFLLNNSIKETLLYIGNIPEYKCFEPKRTSKKDYEEMQELFKIQQWSFLAVSRKYILSDCIALFEVLIKFFETVNGQFPINPLLSVSAPSSICRLANSTLFFSNVKALGIRLGYLAFSTYSLLLSGLSRHNVHPSVSSPIQTIANMANLPFWDPASGLPLPEGKLFYIQLPSIHHHSFFEELFEAIQFINNPSSGCTAANVLIECLLEGNRAKSLSKSFVIGPGITIQELITQLTESIENFETQSGSGENGPQTFASRLRIVNISSSPNPDSIPFSSDPKNIQWKADVKADRKEARRRPTLTLSAVKSLESKLDNLANSITELPSAINSAIRSQPSSTIVSSPLGVNWTPIVQGLVSGVAQSFGATVSFPTTPAKSEQPTVVQQSGVNISPSSTILASLENKLISLESKLNNLESNITQLNNKTDTQISQLTNSITQLTNNTSQLSTHIELIAENMTKLQDGLSQTNTQVSILFEAITSKDTKAITIMGHLLMVLIQVVEVFLLKLPPLDLKKLDLAYLLFLEL